MNRKTNLFYNADSQDSNFITFSNYTESLTGNYLSTDTKLFPSTFLCLKIPRLLNAETTDIYNIFKQEFIQNWLVRRYENKMAFLRDYCKNEDDLVESRLLPLNYLLEYIYEYDPSTEITYIDNVTEQDYNGSFTDTICIINSNKFKHATLIKSEETGDEMYADYKYTDKDKQRYPYSYKYLYGWYTKTSEQYNQSFDMNCDGHVDYVDVEEFKANKDRVIECIKIEHPEWGDTKDKNDNYVEVYSNEYNRRLQAIIAMAKHNDDTLDENIIPTGPTYHNISTVTETIDGECTCPPGTCTMDESGKCCCMIINSTTQEKTIVTDNTTYLSPIFDYPASYVDYPIDIPVKPSLDEYDSNEEYQEAVTEYSNKKIEYDNQVSDYNEYIKSDKYYRITSNLKEIALTEEPNIIDSNSIQSIEFNIVIPLYDVIDMNYDTNSFIITETNSISLENDKTTPCMYIKNVPLGMWFSGKDSVVLKRDLNSKYCPSWSLVIGSQFKPFPYSKQMPDEITASANSDAFMTFAQILTKQNEMIDKMSNLFKVVNDLNIRISDVESNLASTGTSNNLDGLRQDFIDLTRSMNNQITEIKNTLQDHELKWVNREG